MITVLFPSRKRPLSLVRTISSLIAEAWQPNKIEICIAADPDDRITANLANQYGNVYVAPERFGYIRQHEYYNAMLPRTNGDWLFLWGDDARMLTHHWDSFMYAQPRPAVLWPRSNGYAYCFPIVPAAWAQALGRFSPSAHPDSYWYSVGKGLDRHVEIPVSVLHDRKDLTGGHDDATYAEGRGMLGQTGMADDGGAELVAKDVEVLRRLL